MWFLPQCGVPPCSQTRGLFPHFCLNEITMQLVVGQRLFDLLYRQFQVVCCLLSKINWPVVILRPFRHNCCRQG